MIVYEKDLTIGNYYWVKGIQSELHISKMLYPEIVRYTGESLFYRINDVGRIHMSYLIILKEIENPE